MSAPSFYCNVGDVIDVLSLEGATWAADDDRDDTANVQQQHNAIRRAEVRINQYVWPHYDIASFANRANDWVKWCCATFAAVELMRRRGSEAAPGLMQAYNEYLEFLKAVLAGAAEIPEAVPRHTNTGMAMSQLGYDARYRHGRVRVVQRTSTGPQESDVPRNVVQDFGPYG